LKFHAVAEKPAKDSRGLLYFAAPCISGNIISSSDICKISSNANLLLLVRCQYNNIGDFSDGPVFSILYLFNIAN